MPEGYFSFPSVIFNLSESYLSAVIFVGYQIN